MSSLVVLARGSAVLAVFAVLLPSCVHHCPVVPPSADARISVQPQCNAATSHQAVIDYQFRGSPQTEIEIRVSSGAGEDLVLPLVQRGPRGRVAVPLVRPNGGPLAVAVEAYDPVTQKRTTSSSKTELVACRRARDANTPLVIGAVLPLAGTAAQVGQCIDQALRQAAARGGSPVQVVTFNVANLAQQAKTLLTLSRRNDLDALVIYQPTPGSRLDTAIAAATAIGIPVHRLDARRRRDTGCAGGRRMRGECAAGVGHRRDIGARITRPFLRGQLRNTGRAAVAERGELQIHGADDRNVL